MQFLQYFKSTLKCIQKITKLIKENKINFYSLIEIFKNVILFNNMYTFFFIVFNNDVFNT